MILNQSSSASIAAAVTAADDGRWNAFALDSEGEIVKPEILLSDWIELILLFLLLVLGLPLNAIALVRLLRSSPFGGGGSMGSARSAKDITRTSFHWLKIHLTIIDLIVVLLYCPSHIYWLINYTWNAGGFLCKTMQYSWDFCFHLMSFGVVGVAVDRLRTVYGLMRLERTGRAGMCCAYKDQLYFVKRLIFLCYVGAALFSVPQWFVWTTVDFSKWSQCTTIWHKWRAFEYIQGKNITESYQGERLYTLIHLMTVFWLPFLVIFCAYVYIVVYLFYYSLRPYQNGLVDAPIKESWSFVSRPTTTGHDAVHQAEDTSFFHKNSTTLDPDQAPSTATLNGNSVSSKKRLSGFLKPKAFVPAWRVEMRSRIFKTTVYVIAAYLICWMPYNVLSLATFFSNNLQIMISIHLEVLRICVLLNTLLNPFIYGFTHGPS